MQLKEWHVEIQVQRSLLVWKLKFSSMEMVSVQFSTLVPGFNIVDDGFGSKEQVYSKLEVDLEPKKILRPPT